MAVNPLLSLQTKALDFGQPAALFTDARNQRLEREQQQEAIDLKKREADRVKREADRVAEQERLESTLIGSAVLDSYLEQGDIEGAKTYLKTRIKNLVDIDKKPIDSMEALEMAEQDPDRLRRITSAAKREALARGLIEPTDKGGFTLGNTRFDAQGNIIASIEEQQTTTLTPEQAQKEGFPEGAVVQKQPDGDLKVVYEPSLDSDAQQREVDRLMAQGVPEKTATLAASGNLQMTRPDPQGNVAVVDITTGEPVSTFSLAQTRPATGQEEKEDQGPLRLQKQAEAGTGPAAKLKSFWNNVVGPFTGGIPFEDTARSKQALRQFNQFVIQSLVNNPKAPVAEQTRIQGFLPDPDKIFVDPDESALQIEELEQFITEKKQGYEQSLQSSNLPLNERSKLESKLEATNRVLRLMNIPSGDEQTSSGSVRRFKYNPATGELEQQ